jgi:tetratricopeptide (TPR) repeat protein
MAKKSKVSDPKGLKNVEETLSRTEQFLENNYKNLLTGLIVIVLLVGVFWLSRIILGNRQEEAQAQMFQAERYLEMDSLSLALYGDGNYLGFIDIANDYKLTNSGNLARYCAGICYLNLGEYENAIDYLQKYKKKDRIIGSLAIGAIGDAYVEMDQLDKGVEKYIEAAEYADNSFNTPIYLMKAGEIYELSGNYAEALKAYERIEDEYPLSTEGLTIDKYIARVKVLMN